MTSYAQVPADDEENDTDDDIELTGIAITKTNVSEHGGQDELAASPQGESRLPFELLEEQLLWGAWNRWEEPCILSIAVTVVSIPILVTWIIAAFLFTGRLWAVWVFVVHLQFRLAAAHWYIKSITIVSFKKRQLLRFICSMVTLLDIALFVYVYPKAAYITIESFFRDVDGTLVDDWQKQVLLLKTLKILGWIIVLLRVPIGLTTLAVRSWKYLDTSQREWRPTFMEYETFADVSHRRLFRVFKVANLFVLGVDVLCILSAISHFGPWPLWTVPQICDSLDATECALPFPSFHHMRQDSSTATGWRVDLKGLPPLRGGIPFHPRFLNDLDGFSTMAPILFYLDGLKEAHEHNFDSRVELQGPERIEYSTTSRSITLLLNIRTATLVPHSAEVDYLDPDRPLIMVIPARPLQHGTHYALAVVNAADKDGYRLPQTHGMKALLRESNSERRKRYMSTVIPALEKAADWVSFSKNFESIQLVFDFVTMSSESQIGITRFIRDHTVARLNHSDWQWNQHVETVKEETFSCENGDSLISRTIHLHLDVPWFLKHTTSRYSTLDLEGMDNHRSLHRLGKAKGMIQIPCSIEIATRGDQSGRQLRAIMDYGHGLFYHRGEVRDGFLSRMANENGYILIAMDWRGMSLFDLPLIIKTLVATPNLMHSVRDNMIQGYASKFAFQHFARYGLLDWLRLEGKRIPTWKQEQPPSVFYGISQGGILGGGYMALAGSTKLIDRGILGVPGTPFALVVTRSLDFVGYDHLLLLNFYNNRHVRMIMSLLQMAYDSVEASGLLAQPVVDPLPRILLQAGLGDSIVPTSAAEALARAMGASTLPFNPREVFGIPKASPANATWDGPSVTLTELMYETEYNSLPLDDLLPKPNDVHICVRLDNAFIRQVVEFSNTGRVIDPCVEDGCRRVSARC